MMSQKSRPEQIITLCLRVDEYLKIIQKSLAYDEDNSKFENHYWEILKVTKQANWQIHNLATDIEQENFSLEQLSNEFSDEQKKRQQSN